MTCCPSWLAWAASPEKNRAVSTRPRRCGVAQTIVSDMVAMSSTDLMVLAAFHDAVVHAAHAARVAARRMAGDGGGVGCRATDGMRRRARKSLRSACPRSLHATLGAFPGDSP